MENNNRQGCRWTKGVPEDETLGKEWIGKSKEGRLDIYSFDNMMKFFRPMIHEADEMVEYLSPIEPCATSSENYWKQRCEAAEAVIFCSGNEEQDPDEWPFSNLCKSRNKWNLLKSQTPSPTGDCEELKKEVERLKGLLESQFKSNDFYDSIEKGFPSAMADELADAAWLQFKSENNL